MATLLLCLLALPFDPFWPDFEAARRGLLMVCAGAIALGACRTLAVRPGLCGGLALGLAGWHLARSFGFGVANAVDAIDRSVHLLALAALLLWARRLTPERWLRAALPAVAVVAVLGLLQSLDLNRTLYLAIFGDQQPAAWSTPLWWGQALLHTGNPAAPVSTLGNLNVASEFVALGTAGAATLLVRGSSGAAALTTLLLGMAYLIQNGSRSGLVALALALAVVLTANGAGSRRRLRVVIATLAGLGVGLLAHLAKTDSTATDAATTTVELPTPPSTIDVRVEIWRGCGAMVAHAPLLGWGTAQFKVHYPQFRSQREIDLSTTGAGGPRAFQAAPRTAHNDSLEILTETGPIGLLLWLAFGIAGFVAALRHGLALTAPLFAFAAVSMVRSPLGSAPTAALAFGFIGAVTGTTHAGRAKSIPTGVTGVAALAMLALGVSLLLSHAAYADYQAERDPWFRRGRDRVDALTEAIAWDAGNADLHALRLQERAPSDTSDPAQRADLEALARLAPYSTFYLQLRAETAKRYGDYQRAAALAGALLDLDPRHPLGTTLLATIHFERIASQADEAAAVVSTLYHDPHPRLLAALPGLLNEFHDRALERAARLRDVGRHQGAEHYRLAALLFRTEAAFVDAVNALREAPQSAAALKKVQALGDLFYGANLMQDVRPALLLALALHYQQPQTEDYDRAIRRAGQDAERRGLTLTAPHRRILAGIEAPLLVIAAWRNVLAR